MSEEIEKKEYCEKCKEDTIMSVHKSYSHPTTHTCMECGTTYAEVNGVMLVFKESFYREY
jgi:ribosomal protein S27E